MELYVGGAEVCIPLFSPILATGMLVRVVSAELHVVLAGTAAKK